jgi:uncharacterized protein (TIGR02145 family)
MKKLLFLLLLLILGLLVACIPDYDNSIDTENDNSVPPPPQELKLAAQDGVAKVNGTFIFEYVNSNGVVYERSIKGEDEFTPVDTFITEDLLEAFTDSIELIYTTSYEYRLFAYNDNGNSAFSNIAEVITGDAPDNIAPVIKMLYPTEDEITVATKTMVIIFEVTDASGVGTVTVNDNSAVYDSTTKRFSYSLTLTEGKNSFTIIANDIYDNTTSESFLSITYDPTIVDEDAPELSNYTIDGRDIEDSLIIEIFGTSAVLSGIAADISGLDSVDVNGVGASISGTSWTVAVEIGRNSYKEVIVKAIDGSANSNQTIDTLWIKNEVDTVVPEISFTFPSELIDSDSAVVTTASITLTGVATDISGISSIIAGGMADITDSIWSLKITDLPQDAYLPIIIQTRDSSIAKNLLEKTIYLKFDPTKFDETAPTLSITSPDLTGDIKTGYSLITISGKAFDENGIKEVRVNGVKASYEITDSSWAVADVDIATANDGDVTPIVVVATDNSTHANKDTVEFNVVYDEALIPNGDVEGPAINITNESGPSKIITVDNIYLEGAVSDPSNVQSFEVKINGGDPIDLLGGDDSWSKNFTFTKYKNEMVFTAIDALDIPSEKTFTVLYDYPNESIQASCETVDDEITWSWEECEDVDVHGYIIWQSVDATIDANTIAVDTILTTEPLSYVQNIINNSSVYWFKVSILDSLGNTTISVPIQNSLLRMTDGDGNLYSTVTIGDQLWMAENLRTTKYADGTPIPREENNNTWEDLTTPAYCSNSSGDLLKKYGCYYNGYVAKSDNPNKIAPDGWRVPSDEDWMALENYLVTNGHNWDGTTSGRKYAKSLASNGGEWNSVIVDGVELEGVIGNKQDINNSSGFSGIPAGTRNNIGSYGNRATVAQWWTTEGHKYNLNGDYSEGLRKSTATPIGNYGCSIRLVRDLN